MFVSSGAGQDVGRSCILLQMGGKNIMLDCGMHMGYNDEVNKKYEIVSSLTIDSWFFFKSAEVPGFLLHC